MEADEICDLAKLSDIVQQITMVLNQLKYLTNLLLKNYRDVYEDAFGKLRI